MTKISSFQIQREARKTTKYFEVVDVIVKFERRCSWKRMLFTCTIFFYLKAKHIAHDIFQRAISKSGCSLLVTHQGDPPKWFWRLYPIIGLDKVHQSHAFMFNLSHHITATYIRLYHKAFKFLEQFLLYAYFGLQHET